MNPDMINGIFELFGALFLILNVLRIHKDKKLSGVHWMPTVFFTVWGMWNLYYYPSLDQWYSFYGGLLIATVNTVWLLQIFYYSELRKRLVWKSK